MKPRIFVSAVTKELGSARQLVATTLLALGYEPVLQELFETSCEDIRPLLRRKIDTCLAVLQIVGDAYGAEPPTPDETFDRVSYTQYEALYAKSRGFKVYYLIAQADLTRDAHTDTIDAPRDDTEAGRADAEERRKLQSQYRVDVQSTEHIYYPIQSYHEAELSVRRLNQELDKLRRGFRYWMLSVSAALLLIVAGVTILLRGQGHQELQIDQAKQAIDQQSHELRKLTAAVDMPERIREQLIRTIQHTYDEAIADAEKILDWRERDAARKIANEGREQNVSRVEEFLKSIETIIRSGQASPEYVEMTRIFTSQGAAEAVDYIASRKEDLFSRFDREQEINRRAHLLPILESVRKEVLLGRYEAASISCDGILARDPNWGDALHEKILILAKLGEKALHYDTVTLAREHFQRMAEHANRLSSIKPPHVEAQRDLAFSHIRLGEVLMQTAPLKEALAHYEVALKIDEELIQANPLDARAQRDLSIAHNKLGDMMLQMGDLDKSLAHYQDGLTISEQMTQADPANTQSQRDLSISYKNIGDVLLLSSKPDQALPQYQRAFKIGEQLAQAAPGDAQAQRDLSALHDRLGDALLLLHQTQEALTNYQLSFKIGEQLAQADPRDAQTQRDMSIGHSKMGDALLILGQRNEALAHYEKSLQINKQLAQVEPNDAQAQRDLAISYSKWGDVLKEMDKPQEALTYYFDSLKIRRQLAEAEPHDALAQRGLMVSHYKLGELEVGRGRPNEAMEHFARGIAVLDAMIDMGLNKDTSEKEKQTLRERVEVCQQMNLARIPWEEMLTRTAQDLLPTILSQRASYFYQQGQIHEVQQAGEKLKQIADGLNQEKNDQRAIAYFNAGRAYALCRSMVEADSKEWKNQGKLEKELFARLAVESLKSALKSGYKDFDQLRTDTNLDSLRNLSEFQALLPMPTSGL